MAGREEVSLDLRHSKHLRRGTGQRQTRTAGGFQERKPVSLTTGTVCKRVPNRTSFFLTVPASQALMEKDGPLPLILGRHRE